ncbi:putative transcriptional regulator [Janibacter sp. HTCC2649]|uniref:tetratricopeptide repeat protein n=1 Tax=Janibacter sp. HTCC2649 TaxID=313589 RepID=UPI0000670A07|nr:tetratricopeptide repeat protein [Janibacter sp. HTCC2649]EAQ00706.1 putative transcriptional regulator [Janibacter sp. HTCC2649]
MRSLDELAERLQELRIWSGLSYRALHREVVRGRRDRRIAETPAFDTVHRCLQPGRKRVDTELVVDVAAALLGNRDLAAPWRQACQTVAQATMGSTLVAVTDTIPVEEIDFVGRETELATILAAAGDPGCVVAIVGMGGMGKTRLAVHSAHRLAGPDQRVGVTLFVDLRGYDSERPPADPGAVLNGFLRLLGVPADRLALLDVDARQALFRERLAGRTAVLVLDNASSGEQVLPLLAARDSCRVIVTSRHTLKGVHATEIQLDAFDPGDAAEALRRAASPVAVDGNSAEVRTIVELVGGHPLAISLVGARVRATPGWTLADHAVRLAEARRAGRLDAGVDVALGLSYDRLGSTTKRMLRLMALHPGQDLDRYAAAALLGSSLAVTEVALRELVDASLIRRSELARFSLHDLVRIFATHRSHDEEAASARRAAMTRLLNFHDAVTTQAAPLVSPQVTFVVPDPPGVSDSPAPEIRDRSAAQGWLDSEWRNLVTAALVLGVTAQPQHVVRLSAHLQRHLEVGGHLPEAEALHTAAAAIAQGAPRAQALTAMATVCFPLGRHRAAEKHLREALAIYRRWDNTQGECKTLNNLGLVHQQTGDHKEARRHFEAALRLAPNALLKSFPLANLAKLSARLGQHDQALAFARRALAEAKTIDDPTRVAQGLFTVGDQLRLMGRLEEASAALGQSLALARESHFPYCEAFALNALGLIRLELGEPRAAETLQIEALDVAREFGISAVETVILTALGSTLEHLGRPEEALVHYEAALKLASANGDHHQQGLAEDGIRKTGAAHRSGVGHTRPSPST